MKTTAKKLTLDELKRLPRGSAVWAEFLDKSEEGIVWYILDPVVVCEPGENGSIIGGNRDAIIARYIDDHLLEELTIWSSEPDKEQLTGITQKEYDDLPDVRKILFPELATAITSRRYTFEAFCTFAGLDYHDFWDAITGYREFVLHEIVSIRSALNLTDEETMSIFFPEFTAQI